MSKPIEVHPLLPNPALPDANWADAFEVETSREFADMKTLAEQIIGFMPIWANILLSIRNALVAPFGLKTGSEDDTGGDVKRVGIFPVLEETENQIVLGIDDKHLDFRIVVDRQETKQAFRLRATTLVTRHNLFGRIYIALITPFHRLIVRSILMRSV